MKRILFISIILFSIIQIVNSQTFEEYNIVKKGTKELSVDKIYHNDNISYRFYIIGRNNRYLYLEDFTTVYSGNARGMFLYFKSLREFMNETKGRNNISRVINGNLVKRLRAYGMNGINLYNDEGHITFTDSEIIKFSEKFLEYCKKNNIPYR